jgi:hypothetical protein
VGPTCQPAGEREKGGGTSPRGPKGKADRAGKKKKGGGRREVDCGPKGERKGVRFGFFLFFQILLNNFSNLFKLNLLLNFLQIFHNPFSQIYTIRSQDN